MVWFPYFDDAARLRAHVYRVQEAAYRHGCTVAQGDRLVAFLMDPAYFDMFWLAWRIVPLLDDPREQQLLYTVDYWHPARNLDIEFRSRVDGEPITFIVAGDPLSNGRLILRGPYPVDMPSDCTDDGGEHD